MDQTEIGTQQLLEAWWRALATMHIAHHRCASLYRTAHISLGSLAVVLATAAGSSLLLDLVGSTGAGVLALSAAVVGGVNNFLDNGARAGRHHAAAVGFMGLRRSVEAILAQAHGQPPASPDNWSDLRQAWIRVLESAPQIPRRIHDDQKRQTWSYSETLHGASGEGPGMAS